MSELDDAVLGYQQALAQQERARRLASLAQEKADQFIQDAEDAGHKTQDAKNRLLDAAEHHNRDF